MLVSHDPKPTAADFPFAKGFGRSQVKVEIVRIGFDVMHQRSASKIVAGDAVDHMSRKIPVVGIIGDGGARIEDPEILAELVIDWRIATVEPWLKFQPGKPQLSGFPASPTRQGRIVDGSEGKKLRSTTVPHLLDDTAERGCVYPANTLQAQLRKPRYARLKNSQGVDQARTGMLRSTAQPLSPKNAAAEPRAGRVLEIHTFRAAERRGRYPAVSQAP